MDRNDKHEKLFWSIALPGFGQILNGKILKGFLFVSLEFLVNVQSNFNEGILLSFHEKLKKQFNKRIMDGSCFILVCTFSQCGMPIKMQTVEKSHILSYHLYFQPIL